MHIFGRKGLAIPGAAIVAAALVTMCAACAAPATSRTAATARHAADAASPTAASPSPDGSLTPSPSPTGAGTATAAPQSLAPARTSTGKAPTSQQTTAPAVHTTPPRPFSDSFVGVWANVGHIQSLGANQFTVPIIVGISFPTRLGVTYAPATVCADGAPTVTLEYLGTDNAWHTKALTGSAYSGCVNVGQTTALSPDMVDDEMGYGSSLQVKILSVSLRLTGPNGAWTAMGQ